MSIQLGSDPHSFDAELMTAMNTTPLIDVMLVLLVMLIITIPIQLHSVNMNLPKPVLAQPDKKPAVIKLDIMANHQIVWNGTSIYGNAQLQAKLDEAFKASTRIEDQPDIHIRPSDGAKYSAVAAVLAATQRTGFKKIGILSSAESAP